MGFYFKRTGGDGTGVTNLSYTASPTNGAVASDTGTDATITAADGTNAGLFLPTEKAKLSILAGRNKLVNGDFGVSQYNGDSSATVIAGDPKKYLIDRWYAYCTGANVTGQRIAGSGDSDYRYQFTGAASNTAIQIGQRITAENSRHFQGKAATLSVDLANSLLSTVTWTAYYADTRNAFGTIASPTRTQIATGTFTVNSTITRYSAQISIPSAATTGIEVVLSVANQNSGTWTIGDVQLELGSVATPFERRQDQLERCLPHFRFNSTTVGESNGTGTLLLGSGLAFAPPMFSNPTGRTISGVNMFIDSGIAVRSGTPTGFSVNRFGGYFDSTTEATTPNKTHIVVANKVAFEAEL